MRAAEAYRSVPRRRPDRTKVVLLLPKADLAQLDAWGIEAGMPSRSDAIRTLIRQGVQAREAGDGNRA